MKTIAITKNDYTFHFTCYTDNNYKGFKHVVYLTTINNKCINTIAATCYYCNRTWELYTYQSACIKAINKLIGNYKEEQKNTFKLLHNYKKLSAKRTNKLNAILNASPYYIALINCKQSLCNNIY